MLQAAIEGVLPRVSNEAAAELLNALHQSRGRLDIHATHVDEAARRAEAQ